MITRQSTADKAAANAINELFEGRKPSTEGLNERYRSTIDALIEAFEEDGISGVQTAFNALGAQHPDLIKLRAEYDPSKEVEDTDFKKDRQGRQVFATLSEDDVDQLPDIEWLISGVLQHSTVSMLYADSNTGKTFVALDMAMCIARGMSWFGRPVKQGKVLYVYAEGRLGLGRRTGAWKKHHDKPSSNNVAFIARPVNLLQECHTLYATIEDMPEPPVMVVIDTFSMCAPGVNENQANEVAPVLAVASQVKRTYGCHVMIVHHAGKNGDYRGSAAFKGNIDTMIELTRDESTGPIKLHCKKQRDGGYFDDLYLQLQQVQTGFNEETLEKITSCVVVQAEKVTPRLTDRQLAMLQVLAKYESLTNTDWKQLCKEEENVPENTFDSNLRVLKKQGEVKLTGTGKGAKYSLT